MADRDHIKLVGKPNFVKNVASKAKTQGRLCFAVAIAFILAVVSLATAIFTVCKVLELSDEVSQLRTISERNYFGNSLGIGEIEIDDVHYDDDLYDLYENGYRGSSSGEDDNLVDIMEDEYWEDDVDEYDDGNTRERRTAVKSRTGKEKHRKGSKSPKGRNKSTKHGGKNCELETSPNGELQFKDHHRQCFDAFTAFIKEEVDEYAGQAAIHLAGNVTVSEDVRQRLANNASDSFNLPHGLLSDQGYTSRDDILAFWTPSDWVNTNQKTKKHFDVIPSEGDVTEVKVKVAGVYFIYAQVTSHETHPTNYFAMKSSGRHKTTQELLSCITDVNHSGHRGDIRPRYRTCHTSGVAHLDAGDRVYLMMRQRAFLTVTAPYFTYWGLIHVN